MKIKWKRPNDIGQTMSQCGRYWFVWLDDDYLPAYPPGCRHAFHGFVQLRHDDTRTIVGHFETVEEAKAAAQGHFETMRRDMVLTNR